MKDIKKYGDKPIRCVELNIIFPSIVEAVRWLNPDSSVIDKVCREEIETTCGYHWEFVEEEI